MNVRDHVFTVANGEVTNAARTDSDNGSNIRWEITVEPDGTDDVTVVLPPTTDCGDPGAVCTSYGKMLSNRDSITVAGPSEEESEDEQPEQEETSRTPTGPPPAPIDLTVTVNTDGSITLFWDAPDDDSITGYQVLRRRPTQDEDTLKVYVEDTGSTSTTYTDSNTPGGDTYVYRVKALNSVGAGDWSNFVLVVRSN